MSNNKNDFFESSLKRRNEESDRAKALSFNESHDLPKHLKSRDELEKEFKDYLSTKEDSFERKTISPPFEVSKVPSPVYGYKRPKAKKQEPKYSQLKDDMVKKPAEFIFYEDHVPPEVSAQWGFEENRQMDVNKDKVQPAKELSKANDNRAKVALKPQIKRGYGLHRTLAAIIEEEKSGNNSGKSEVPGLFHPRKNGK
ncbi:hypothetical protein [Alkalibacterium sp. MB6]|uniref:hypothetical protein n=1 Tax=Alkalibacterium sp. MB6 TaxID=2081965 RepID=UPI001379EB80|nr:hypothetical protein [Alkalibacterium sp. MB6]